MKKAIKLKIIALLMIPFVGLLALVSCMMMMFSDDSKNSLTESVVDNPERIAELMLLRAYGVPIDLIMMVASYGSLTTEEALQKPLMFIALEFMIMSEEVKDYVHDHAGRDPDSENYHSRCGYVTTEINTYSYKEEIKQYLGIRNDDPAILNAGNLYQLAQDEADDRCSSNQVRIITFGAIAPSEYEEALRRCGIESEEDIEGMLELHQERYFNEWLEGVANSAGVNPGDSSVISSGTHHEIWRALQRPDLDAINFFGGSAIVPLPSGTYSITSEFGPRNFAPDPYHTGLDFAAAAGTPIYSAMDGTVLMRLTNLNTFGHHIVIYHGGSITTMYAHMSAFGSYNVGDSVSQGDVIGYVGNTGLSRGNHLHFEYQVNGTAHNPRGILPIE